MLISRMTIKWCFLILMNLAIKIHSKETSVKFTKFECFEEEANDLIQSFKAFTIYRDQIYLFSDDLILKFDLPAVALKNDSLLLAYLKSKPAYFMKTSQIPSNTRTILNLTDEIIGYIVNSKDTYVIHSNYSANLNSYKINKLNFASIPGQVGPSNSYLRTSLFHFENPKFMFLVIEDSKYFQVTFLQTKNGKKIQFDSKRTIFSFEIPDYRSYQTIHLIYFEERDVSSLIELDTRNVFHITQYEFGYSITDFYTKKEPIRFHLSFKELFNCKCPFKNDEEVKGVFYKNNFFFIFINNFYLMTKSDLIKKGFQLDSAVYRNARYINFESPNFNYYYLDRFNDFIKNLDIDRNYLTFDSRTFKLDLTRDPRSGEQYLIASTLKINYFDNCFGQTLSIDKNVFCFHGNEYTYLFHEDENQDGRTYSRRHTYEIFENSNMDWKTDKKLTFIFQYKADFIVFMTDLELFVFKFQLLHLNETSKEIKLKKTTITESEHFIVPNCLYGKRPTSSCVTTYEVSSSNSDNSTDTSLHQRSVSGKKNHENSNLVLNIVTASIILVILICLAGIIVIVVKKNKNQSVIKSQNPSELISLTESRIKNLLRIKRDKIWSAPSNFIRSRVTPKIVNPKIQSANSKIQSANSKIRSANSKIQSVKTKIQSVNSKIQSVNSKIQPVKTKNLSVNSKIQSVKTKNLSVNSKIQSIKTISSKNSIPLVINSAVNPGVNPSINSSLDSSLNSSSNVNSSLTRKRTS